MVLDEQDLKNGMKLIAGKWQVDYVVNAFSDDLAHIPAAEFKSEDGNDFSSVTYEFFEDHTVIMREASSGREEHGTWEQTGWSDFHYTLNGFLNIPEGPFRDNAEKLSLVDGALVFSVGFLAIGMKKIEEGNITEEPDIGDIEPTAEEAARMDIVGTYEIAKAMSFVGGEMGFYTLEEVEADCKQKLASGEMDEDDVRMQTQTFGSRVEITADHLIKQWMKIPEGITEEQIREALEAGEIKEVKDGCFNGGENKWKFVRGAFYYDTGEQRELFGEAQSSWDELKFDDEGLLEFGSGMMKLRKL